MDIASIGAAYEGLKHGKEILSKLYDLKVSSDANEKISLVSEKLGTAQDTLFSLREELFRLQEENKALRDAAEEKEAWKKRVESYELVETNGSAVVYKFLGSPAHFACPKCIEQNTIQILQDTRTMSGEYECVGCSSRFPVKPREKIRL